MFQIFIEKFGTYFKNCRKMAILELCRLRRTWERDDVTDVLHTGDEQDKALEAETETGMRA